MAEEKPYLDPELSLQTLAKRMEITKEDLSQVINEQLDRNFKNFINEYRIEEAKKKLLDPKEDQFVLMKIAFDVGFNSKSVFNASFKKFTGMSPSQYRKKHQERK
jgi:YesN/AraC family two-component response regulator